MKITLWRFAHDCLPLGQQLRRRKIPAFDSCINCGRAESAAHTFLFYQFARDVWSDIKQEFGLHLQRKGFLSCKAWVFDFLARSSPRQCTALTTVMWHLWENRNSIRNGDPMRHPHSVALQAMAYIDMIELHLFHPLAVRATTELAPRWSPPPVGSMYINVDAALFSSSRQMGVGVVIRNHLGECVAACSELIPNVVVPELAEAFAIRRALSLAGEEGYANLIVASDCLSLVQRLTASTLDRSAVGVVIQDILFLASTCTSISFKHVSRSCNHVAHVLARSADQLVSSVSRFDTPDCIRETLYDDVP